MKANRPMRSLLLAPGGDADALAAAFEAGADAILVCLGGEMSPDRAAARRTACSVLQNRSSGTHQPAVFVALHHADGTSQTADLDTIMPAAPDGFVLPLSAGPAAIALLDSRLAVQEALHGLADRSTRIIPAYGNHAATALPLAGPLRDPSSRLVALAWYQGEDWLTNSEAIPPSLSDGGLDSLVRNLTLFAAGGAGLPVLHCAWRDLTDTSGLESAAVTARRDGFSGMFAIDVAQIATLNAVFA